MSELLKSQDDRRLIEPVTAWLAATERKKDGEKMAVVKELTGWVQDMLHLGPYVCGGK